MAKQWDIYGKNNGIYWAKTMGYNGKKILYIFCGILVKKCWK